MVLLWLLSGLRPAEPRTILTGHLGRHGSRMTLHLPHRKGGTGDTLLLPTITTAAINRHLGPADHPLLRTQRGSAFSKSSARGHLLRFCDRHDLDPVTPYSLRVTYITLALESGAEARHVAGSAGHSIAMTGYYDRLHGAMSKNPAQHLADWLENDETPPHQPEGQ